LDRGPWHAAASGVAVSDRGVRRSGKSDVAIAEELSVNRNTVILWRQRFSEEGLDDLRDIAPGRGRKPTYEIDKIAAIVEATLHTKPTGMTHWSCRTMAQSQNC
jgi:transposase